MQISEDQTKMTLLTKVMIFEFTSIKNQEVVVVVTKKKKWQPKRQESYKELSLVKKIQNVRQIVDRYSRSPTSQAGTLNKDRIKDMTPAAIAKNSPFT